MARTIIILSALIALLNPVPVETSTATDAPPLVSIVGASESADQRIEWALARFEAAGIDLPPLTVRVHDSKDDCEGHSGLYRAGDETDLIDICTVTEFIILHELGHAWERRFASDDLRNEFLGAAGLDHWSGADVEYRERGEEAAANVVSWGLIPRELDDSEIRRSADLLELFELLTGTVSPRLPG